MTVATCPTPGNVAPAYTADDVASLFTLRRGTIIALAKAGELPHVRIGKAYRFPRAKIDALVNGES